MRGWAIALGLALAAGCSGGDEAADESVTTTPATEAPTTLPATTTTEPGPTTTTTVPLYSFDGSVPPPPLVNTGTDYEAIYRSISAYQHWLDAHDPSPELIDEIVVPGTPLYEAYEQDYALLAQNDARAYDTAAVITRVDVITEDAMTVTLLVEYTDERKVIVARDGRVLDDAQLPSRSQSIAVLAVDQRGIWRLVTVEDAGSAEVVP